MNPVLLLLGLLACYAALGVVIFLVVAPPGPRLAADRRRPGLTQVSMLSEATSRTVGTIERLLSRRGWQPVSADTLEQAGLRMRPGDFILLVISGGIVGALLGMVFGGLLAAVLFAAAARLVAKMLLAFRTSRRRSAFAEQLDDSLQLLAGGLRAGHSILRAIDAVSQEAESPTAEEFARVINETRLGRDLGHALDQTAARMRSDDFLWVAQAIAIQREVGGDLAGVLDQVGHTIRERNQIRRQVKALSAEGKLSAYVLMALPVGIIGFLAMVRPEYIGKLTQNIVGYGLIGMAVVLFAVGGLWMRKVVRIRF